MFFRALVRWGRYRRAGAQTRSFCFRHPALSRRAIPAGSVSALLALHFYLFTSLRRRARRPAPYRLRYSLLASPSLLRRLRYSLFTIKFILTIFSGNLSLRSPSRFVCFASAKIITINRICKKNSNFFTEIFYLRAKQSFTIIFHPRPCPSLRRTPAQVTPLADLRNPTHRLR